MKYHNSVKGGKAGTKSVKAGAKGETGKGVKAVLNYV